jgi:hypothetical protein
MEDEYNDNYKTLHVAQIVNTEQLQTLYTLETWFVSGMQL